MRSIRAGFVALTFAVGLAAVVEDSRAQQLYTITTINPLEGHSGSVACGINNAGIVVGGSGGSNAYRWDGTSATALPPRPGGTLSAAKGINNRGEIVGVSTGSISTDRGVVWAKNADGFWTVFVLPVDNADLFSAGAAINRLGQVAGTTDNGFRSLAAYWEHVDDRYRHTQLPLIAGHDNGIARDLHPTGLIVVGSSVIGQLSHAVAWTKTDGGWAVSDLGGLSAAGAAGANGINTAGIIVGWALGSDGVEHAALWQHGIIQDLGSLADKSTYALAINTAGDVVGETWSGIGIDSAFVRLAKDSAVRDLNALIPPGLSWRLTSATDINDRGDIAGFGVLNGFFNSFVLHPITMFLDAPTAAETGQLVTLTVTGGSVGSRVWFFSSTTPGETSLENGADSLDIANPTLLDIVTADDTGTAQLTLQFPGVLAGQDLRLQAYDPTSGRVSDVRLISDS